MNSKYVIDSFSGAYDFLSNFYDTHVYYNHVSYLNAEAAFQAQKCIKKEDCKAFMELSASEAKALGRKIDLRPDWENIKEKIMYGVCLAKFTDDHLRKKLLDTGYAYLVEGNTWGDQYWGVCNGKGENKLGQILMRVREDLRAAEKMLVDETELLLEIGCKHTDEIIEKRHREFISFNNEWAEFCVREGYEANRIKEELDSRYANVASAYVMSAYVSGINCREGLLEILNTIADEKCITPGSSELMLRYGLWNADAHSRLKSMNKEDLNNLSTEELTNIIESIIDKSFVWWNGSSAHQEYLFKKKGNDWIKR